MTTISTEVTETLADLVNRLGDIPLDRIRMHPSPGNATEEDLIRASRPLCELVDGVLINKAMGYYESRLALVLGGIFEEFLQEHDLGFVVGPDALTRLQPDQVREPDMSFVRWERLPQRKVPRDPIASLPPDLAVEILSTGNTKREIDRIIREYFDAGVRVVWIVDPPSQTVKVYSSVEESILLTENDTLECAELLPGFSLAIREWFDRAG